MKKDKEYKLKIGDLIYIESAPEKIMVVTKISFLRKKVWGTRFTESGHMGDFSMPMDVVKLRKVNGNVSVC